MPNRIMHRVTRSLTLVALMLGDRLSAPAKRRGEDDDRGDVPGWVMITVKTTR